MTVTVELRALTEDGVMPLHNSLTQRPIAWV
jgi:hypothetical protein